jgi:hypothetical protein
VPAKSFSPGLNGIAPAVRFTIPVQPVNVAILSSVEIPSSGAAQDGSVPAAFTS